MSARRVASERPIEEVIEWRPAIPGQDPILCGWAYDEPDGGHVRKMRAEVDDLAAWLDGHLTPAWAWSLHHWLAGTESRFCCHGYEDRADGTYQWDTDDYPTVLAALAAAVRRVAGEVTS